MTEYYINNVTGANGNHGLSKDQPWESIAYALRMIGPADVLHVASGSYMMEGGISRIPDKAVLKFGDDE